MSVELSQSICYFNKSIFNKIDAQHNFTDSLTFHILTYNGGFNSRKQEANCKDKYATTKLSETDIILCTLSFI